MTRNVFPVSYLEPCFLLSSPRLYFPLPVDAPLKTSNPHILFKMQSVTLVSSSAPGSHQLLFVVYFIVYLVLVSCSCIHIKTNIYIITLHSGVFMPSIRLHRRMD